MTRKPTTTACAFGTPWLDHFEPPVGTGKGCAPCDAFSAEVYGDVGPPPQKQPPLQEHPRMFAPHSPMTLTDVTFTTETEDDETRRVVVCTFAITPFTSAQAEALNVRSLLFDTTTGLPKDAIDTIVVNIAMPLQRLTFALAPDVDGRVVLPDVAIEPKLRARVKKDRDPLAVDAVLKVSFRYPDAQTLLYIANGVNDVHYLTFETQQGDLLDGEELRPGVFAEH